VVSLSGREDIGEAQLRRLLSPDVPASGQIAAATIAAARQDPALIPWMFESFLASKYGHLRADPDVFERLLRGLQSFPHEALEEGLRAADLHRVPEQVLLLEDWAWMGPISDGNHRLHSRLRSEELQERCRGIVTRWVEGILERGPTGLTLLQTDSGNVATLGLRSSITSEVLADAMESGEQDLPELALETALQRDLIAPRSGDGPKTIDQAILLLRQRPILPRNDQVILHPVVAITLGPAAGETLAEAIPDPSSANWIVGLLGISGFWLLVMIRRHPALRPHLFRCVALLSGPALVLLLEGVLWTLGVSPPVSNRPTFNTARVPDQVFVERVRGGVDTVEIDGPGFRWQLFEHKKAGLRVVTLGGSSTHATHYLNEESFSEVLERRLTEEMQGTDVEVLNLGIGGGLSDQAVHYARAVSVYEPDLYVVYLGRNDLLYLHRLAGFSAFSPRELALRMELDRWRVTTLLGSFLPGLSSPSQGARLDDASAGPSDKRQMVRLAEDSLSRNLVRLSAIAAETGAELLYVLQADNEDLCKKPGSESTEEGCLPESYRSLVLKAAGRTGRPVVDAPAAIAARVQRGQRGHKLFWDEIHPTQEGHALIGEAIAPTAARLLSGRVR
jgi:lysophospholipase L1-like esterase